MKKQVRVSDIAKKALIAFLAAVIAFTTIEPVNVEAKTKTITLKPQSRTSYAEETRAKKISKKGTYNIKVKDNGGYFEGYLKFVAPKAGTYKFAFSKVKDAKKKPVSGSVYATTPGEYGLYDINFNGSTPELYLANKNSGVYKKSQTGKLSLRKNQAVYLFFSFQKSYSSKAKYMNVNLKIK